VELAPYTTLRLGGPAARLVEARTEEELVRAVREAGEHVMVLAGGSNVVVADDGVPGTVVRVTTRGVARRDDAGRALLEVQAGEPWDPFVARTVADGLAGLECLSGIPGSVGATPIQNVGAYGQEVGDRVVAVRALDRARDAVAELDRAACAFAYRTSVFKREPGRYVVLAVTFALAAGDGRSEPIRYAELARRLGVEVGERAPLRAVRDAVLALRRAKGMVVDPADPDSVSVGSFFTNPVLTREQLAEVERRAQATPPAWPQPDGTVKTSAAWLIERAGFGRGYGDPATIAISTKHTLALTNRGGGTTEQLVALARTIAAEVERRFGVRLVPEPVFVGHAWE
jgi:UDP-N-acetylmuramate dehydrogenase